MSGECHGCGGQMGECYCWLNTDEAKAIAERVKAEHGGRLAGRFGCPSCGTEFYVVEKPPVDPA